MNIPFFRNWFFYKVQVFFNEMEYRINGGETFDKFFLLTVYYAGGKTVLYTFNHLSLCKKPYTGKRETLLRSKKGNLKDQKILSIANIVNTIEKDIRPGKYFGVPQITKSPSYCYKLTAFKPAENLAKEVTVPLRIKTKKLQKETPKNNNKNIEQVLSLLIKK